MRTMTATIAAVAASVALLLPAVADARPGWKACGQSKGSFPVRGAPAIRAAVKRINARFVPCAGARRFARRMYFGQECVRCDAPDTYHVGERVRYRGFLCRVRGHRSRGPSRFHCTRGRMIVNFRTVVYI